MMNSTFYTDGYRDAVAGHPVSLLGVSVYDQEYYDGYQDGYYSFDIESLDPVHASPFNHNLVR